MAEFEPVTLREPRQALPSSQAQSTRQLASAPGVLLALQRSIGNRAVSQLIRSWSIAPSAAHGPIIRRAIEAAKMNIVGETHAESEERRSDERAMLKSVYSFSAAQYWTEDEFKIGQPPRFGDSPSLRLAHSAGNLLNYASTVAAKVKEDLQDFAEFGPSMIKPSDYNRLRQYIADLLREVVEFDHDTDILGNSMEYVDNPTLKVAANKLRRVAKTKLDEWIARLERISTASTPSSSVPAASSASAPASGSNSPSSSLPPFNEQQQRAYVDVAKVFAGELPEFINMVSAFLKEAGYDNPVSVGHEALAARITRDRSKHMIEIAAQASGGGITGVWKVGQEHANDMRQTPLPATVTLTSKDEFDSELEKFERTTPSAKAESETSGH